MVDHEGRNSSHAISPKREGLHTRCPCVYLFGCVIFNGDAMYRRKKHLVQVWLIADAKLADLHVSSHRAGNPLFTRLGENRQRPAFVIIERSHPLLRTVRVSMDHMRCTQKFDASL